MEQQYAIIVDGVVDNTALATPIVATSFGWTVLLPSGFGRGDLYDAENGTFSRPPAPPVAIPRGVTRRQGKRALEEIGLLAGVEQAIAAMPKTVQIDWAEALTFDRDSEAVALLAAAIPLSDKQLDDLFTLAATFT